MKSSHFRKNTRLGFALLTVLFLNLLWVQKNMTPQKNEGQMILSSSTSYYDAEDFSHCDGDFTFESANSDHRRVTNDGSVRLRSIRNAKATYTVDGVSVRGGGNITNCTDHFGGETVNTGNQVHEIKFTIQEDIECDACGNFSSSSTREKTVYIIGGAVPDDGDINNIIKQIKNQMIEEAKDRLKERSRAEQERRCQINPDTGKSYRTTDLDERLDFLECKINFAFEEHEDDETRQERAIKPFINTMYRLALNFKNKGEYDSALEILNRITDSEYSSLLSERRLNSIENQKEIIEIYAEQNVTAINFSTGEETQHNFHSLAIAMGQASLRGDQKTYNQLLRDYNKLRLAIQLKVIESGSELMDDSKTAFNAELNAIRENTFLESMKENQTQNSNLTDSDDIIEILLGTQTNTPMSTHLPFSDSTSNQEATIRQLAIEAILSSQNNN